MGVGASVDPRLADLRAELSAWLGEFGLAERLFGAVEAASAWAGYCSPRGASDRQRRLAALDLTLWLFAVDDYDGEHGDAYLQRCRRQLHGVDVGDDPIDRARARLTDELLAGTSPSRATRYFASRSRYVDAIARRNRVRDGRDPMPSYERYLDLRETTIYVEQWVEVWGLLTGFDLGERYAREPALKDAERAIAHCHIFQNEPRSLERDRSSRTPNLVDLLCARDGHDVTEGCQALARLHLQACDAFDAAIERVRRAPGISASYLELLDACRWGGRRATDRAGDRYRSESTTA